ncbi:MAG: hypothetical protein CVV03_10325 [Firmicutes bacterium HGW-Firmicutes-8]|nr:MAG: hypothetical protein CVV03_10325 [Firmicutes bacterium HGW-Firmicutes-8]
MGVKKTYAEINEKIKSGKVVVVTAEEIIGMVEEKGVEAVAREVDVVTTGTFGPMCSSGAFFNFGHPKPRIKMHRVWMNGVPAYTGIAAVDAYLGATELPDYDPLNSDYPGEFRYGGGHVIEDLLAGKSIKFEATGYGTDCYPRKKIETYITLDEINEAFLFNPRNAYQNYNIAVNASNKTIYTYMGTLKPNIGNAHYCSAGQLSPLLNDPYYRTIGIGTRIFLGGGVGYVGWNGTQHSPCGPRGENGVPLGGSGTLSVVGDLKQMSPQWLRGASFLGYGATLTVGIGIPIPVLDEESVRLAAVKDSEIFAPVVDYSDDYPNGTGKTLGSLSYAQLKSGVVEINGKEVSTAPLSSYVKAREIAGILKQWIVKGEFLLSEPAQTLPSADSEITFKGLQEKSAP